MSGTVDTRPRIDVHQHLWTEGVVGALAKRRSGPRVRRDRHAPSGWTLEVPGERPWPLWPLDGDVDGRLRLAANDGIDRVLVALSTVVAAALPPAEAEPVTSAWLADAAALPDAFRAWGALPPSADPAEVDALLDAGCVGLCLPASAVASPASAIAASPLLERLEARDAPLFIHPGAPARTAGAASPGANASDGRALPLPGPGAGHARPAPSWWPALTGYVAEMQAAWLALLASDADLPRPRVVFAMLAGCAPLQLERLAARGGPSGRELNRRWFYDTSSYGPRAIDAMARMIGVDQLVHGSDRPVVAPPDPHALGEAFAHAMLVDNPARLLGGVPRSSTLTPDAAPSGATVRTVAA